MSEVLLLSIGAVIFAITTMATVFAGGVTLTRISDRERREQELKIDPVAVPTERAPGH